MSEQLSELEQARAKRMRDVIYEVERLHPGMQPRVDMMLAKLYDEVARLREERAARQVDPPGGLAPEHIKVTPGGATHWSSGPGNLTFSTQCPRCWYDQAQRLQARIKELESELRACSATLRSVEKHYGEYGVGHVI